MRYSSYLSLLLLPASSVFSIPLDGSVGTVRYDNHKLISVKRTPESWDLVQKEGFDVWQNNKNGLHVRVAPSDIAKFAALDYEVLMQDVQSKIDEEARSLRRNHISKRCVSDPEWFKSYHPYEEVLKWLADLSKKHNELVSYIPSIGKSIEGRDIPALRITSKKNINKGNAPKKQYYFQGLQHAREWISTASMQFVADTFASSYKQNKQITRILDTSEILIVPIVNPDGYAYSWTKDRLWRKNRRVVKDPIVGVDLNRNWPDHWDHGGASHNPKDQTYLGTAPGSEPEVKAVMDFYLKQKNIAGAIDFHSYGELIMWPFGWTQERSPWDEEFKKLGAFMKEAVNKVNATNAYVPQMDAELYIASGGADDWFFGDDVTKKQGFRSTGLTVELSPFEDEPGFILPPERIIPTGKATVAMVKNFIDYVSKNPLSAKSSSP
ncbi:hypothetical protein K7432_001608 [Basidiobolus ranarum]|uniref:Peptidase M14 domain-containing protein n=1 Tax=Basidiobolus ranarum TaxID=34480 RepID=A0ABR2X2T6_9FUNG